MRFGMRRPCTHCPWRADVPAYIRPAHARAILESVMEVNGAPFPCHESTVDQESDEGWDERVIGPATQHCAGALIFMRKINALTLYLVLAERLAPEYSPDLLDMHAPVFESVAAYLAHHSEDV